MTTKTPNQHNIVWTVINRFGGKTCESQDPHHDFSTLAEATAAAEAELAEARATIWRDDGSMTCPDGRTMYWHLQPTGYRIHSWHNEFLTTPPVFAPAPLSGPGWDDAWKTGPGRDAL
jgi:hypothetical protein